MSDDQTHYERTSLHTARAKMIVARHGENIEAALVEAATKNFTILLEVFREYLEPAVDGTNFVGFFQHPRVLACARALMALGIMVGTEVGVEGEIKTQLNVCWHQITYRNHGKRTYIVSQGMAQRLLVTELRGVRGQDFVLPYPAIYVQVPPELGLVINNAHTGEHVVYGVYVAEDVRDGERGLVFLVCGLPNENSLDEFDDAIAHFRVPLFNDVSIDDSLNMLRQHVEMYRSQQGWDERMNMKDVDVNRWVAIFKWVMNMCFYVTRPGFDDIEHIELNKEATSLWRRIQKLPKGKKRDRLIERYRREKKRPRIVVGSKIAFSKHLPRSVDEVTRPLAVRSLVAGHWQRYAVGKGRKERVWKYREPFWRGPEDAVEGSNIHEVK